jgi:hypothetical protein
MRERGVLVGRRVVGRLGLGRSFAKQNLIQGWAKTKVEQNLSLENKGREEKNTNHVN